MNWKERILLILMASVNFTHILDFMVMMPLGNFLMPYFKITPGQFSVIVASYSISAAVSGFAAAFFVDGYDRKKVLLFGYTGFVIGTICCGIAPTYLLLLAARITAGLFGGLIGAQVLSIVADSFPYEKRGQAMGILFSAFSLASIVGVPAALYLAGWTGWHTPFLAIGGLGVIIILLLSRYLPAMSAHIHGARTKPVTMLKNVVSSRKQLVALGLSGALMLGHFLIIPFLNPYMEFNVGFTDTQRNMIYMVGGLATFFTSPLIGKLADKYGKHNTFMVFALISLIPIFLITNMPAIKYYYVLMVTGIWFVLSTGRGIPAQAIISNVVPAEQRGSFMSFNGSIQQLFSGIASLIAGAIVISKPDHTIVHYSWVGYLSIAIVLCSVFIARKLLQYEKAG
ncbi:MFS transporter [Sediminibacterium goheungense]|uniref:Putative MFS family arabinose efflux permease n=1 Tax=Sediminibacterium goheungense TaxID=1086393 RepID=A0A4R6J2J1_9BACT|nr:MFS transporter [Sediminibacterium goheungense]TDO28486.1 putative MFS family arabinose efflux permease [Sediminibacterium goheungense]